MSYKIISLEIEDTENLKRYGALDYNDAVDAIENILGLSSNQIQGIQKFGISARKIDIAIDEDAFDLESVQVALDEKYVLESRKQIIVCLPESEITDIFIKNIPMYWSYERVERIFDYFGDIKEMKNQKIQFSEVRNREYAGKANGIIKIKMKMRKAIPSTLNIDNCRIEIYYKDQVRTCWRCGQGHRKSECRTAYRNFVNRFSIEQFPVLSKHKPSATNQAESMESDQGNQETQEIVDYNILENDQDSAENTQGNGNHVNAENLENHVNTDNNSDLINTENVIESENVIVGDTLSTETTLRSDHINNEITLGSNHINNETTLRSDHINKETTLGSDHINIEITKGSDQMQDENVLKGDHVNDEKTLERNHANVEKESTLESDRIDPEIPKISKESINKETTLGSDPINIEITKGSDQVQDENVLKGDHVNDEKTLGRNHANVEKEITLESDHIETEIPKISKENINAQASNSLMENTDIAVEVHHNQLSQEVKYALPSPNYKLSSEETETASESEVLSLITPAQHQIEEKESDLNENDENTIVLHPEDIDWNKIINNDEAKIIKVTKPIVEDNEEDEHELLYEDAKMSLNASMEHAAMEAIKAIDKEEKMTENKSKRIMGEKMKRNEESSSEENVRIIIRTQTGLRDVKELKLDKKD